MRLEAIAAELRPRNAWEATDLGLALARRWRWPVHAAWFAVAAPLFLLLHLLCWGNWWLVPWLLWWLKPLLDRPPLYVLARALFGDPPDGRRFREDLFGLLRRDTLAALTWRRFDPARSFSLPVAQLEGLSGKARHRRLRDLGRPGRGPAIWLTVVCLHLEIALDFALIVLVWMLVPDFVALDFFDLLDDSEPLGQFWLNVVGFCGLSLVEPFYVAAGFALYLNRRTWLEAWDLELGFRRLAARLATLGRAAALLMLVALGTGSLANPSLGLAADRDQSSVNPANSADAASAPTAESNPPATEESGSLDKLICDERRQREAQLARADSPVKRALAETLREPELRICERQERWRFRADEPEKPETAQPRTEALGRRFAAIVEYLLWLALGLSVVLVGWWSWRTLPGQAGFGRRAPSSGAPLLAGRSQAIASPGAGPGDAAWDLWRNGQPRESLRLLYRASLAGLSVQYGLAVRSSATEDECLRLAGAQLADPELIGFFRRLTRAWQATAYAHRPPDDAEARALCERWPRHFALSGEWPA